VDSTHVQYKTETRRQHFFFVRQLVIVVVFQNSNFGAGLFY